MKHQSRDYFAAKVDSRIMAVEYAMRASCLACMCLYRNGGSYLYAYAIIFLNLFKIDRLLGSSAIGIVCTDRHQSNVYVGQL